MNEINSEDTKNIVYILGHARSGSTILNIILGNIKGVFAAGEISNYATSGWNSEEYCSCGKKTLECEFWAVVHRSVEASLSPDLKELKSVTNVTENWRNILPGSRSTMRKNLTTKYNQFAVELYNAIFDRSESSWIVDASKSPMRIHSLLQDKKLNYYVIHVVRDPRAVCYSLNKTLKKNLKAGVQKDLPGRPYLTTIKELYLSAVLSILVKRQLPTGRYFRVKHEDLVSSTGSVLQGVESFLGADCSELISHLENDGVLSQSHNVAGNRLRMQKNIQLRYDNSWLAETGAAKYVWTSLVLAPLLLWFGYPLFGQKRSEKNPRLSS